LYYVLCCPHFFLLFDTEWFHSKLIPVRGKHLDEFGVTDKLFVGISKAATAPFVYFYLRYAYFEPNVLWDWKEITVANTALPFVALFVVYDFFYTILHWFLHIKGIYGFIHKHHHHQKAPSRANVDAVNVHPLEFFLGEYNHLWTLFLCCRVLQIHLAAAFMFLAVGGIIAGINHTRYDMVLSVRGWDIFDSKAHDVHHRIPQSNYGQYTMLWDTIFGTYRAYDPKDRVNPEAQLDPLTGKSMEYMMKKTIKTQ
jgi:sterol desaturase/sphingolipid hydroxylase (fatty acid hydroxylase superfamily)